MSRPFWLVNSSLLLLCMLTFAMAYFIRVRVPERKDIEPILYSAPKKEQQIAINIRHIYEHDLFGTFKKQVPQKPKPEKVELPPEPPMPQRVMPPEQPKLTFLEPLNITLRGIIVSTDDTKSNAMIADNKTNQEGTFKVGDTVQDAQLIRIFSNKIILLRNNGQQEVLYLREQDAKTDPAFAQINDWHTSVTRKDGTHFHIASFPFLKRVENLPHFIEMLNLTTAYQKGEPVGMRIGSISQDSLGAALGFIAGDIVTEIQQIPATTIQNRVTIYNTIIKMSLPNVVELKFLRNGRLGQFFYEIEEMKQEKVTIKSTKPIQQLPGAASNQNNLQIDYPSVQQPFSDDLDYDNGYDSDDMFAQMKDVVRKREMHNMVTHAESPEHLKKAKDEKI